MSLPFSFSRDIDSFIASFLFLLARTLAVTPFILGSFFSSGGGGGARRPAAFARLSEATCTNPNTKPANPNVVALLHLCKMYAHHL